MARDFPTDELLALYSGMLQMDSAPMRRVAVWELGRLGDPRGAEPLVQAVLGDPDWECRHYAIMALANAGGENEARLLRGLITNGYLSQDGRCPAGAVPDGLAEHLAGDIEYSAKCCVGELPRPTESQDRHGEWWRRG